MGTTSIGVGVANDVFGRCERYKRTDPNAFTHMFVLHRTRNGEAAEFLEATLIDHLRCTPRFVNKERRDIGGSGNYRGYSSGVFVYIVAFKHPDVLPASVYTRKKRLRSRT